MGRARQTQFDDFPPWKDFPSMQLQAHARIKPHISDIFATRQSATPSSASSRPVAAMSRCRTTSTTRAFKSQRLPLKKTVLSKSRVTFLPPATFLSI